MSAIHREHPDATPEKIETLERAGLLALNRDPYATAVQHAAIDRAVARVGRTCRDCGAPYTVAAEHATSTSKWASLCPSCLAWEL